MNVRQDSSGADPGKLLQWHPAFFAGIQIELKDEADNLIFEQEHLLGTKPMGIDVPGIDNIKIEELTISLICEHFPQKMVQHLEKVRGYSIDAVEEGIYYIKGDMIPIQLIVTGQLSNKENLWLRCLTNRLDGTGVVRALLEDYKNHEKNRLYKPIMDIIVTANKDNFKEVKDMCEALEELIQERLDARALEAENRVNELILKLLEQGRTEDIAKSAADPEYQKQLFEEFGL